MQQKPFLLFQLDLDAYAIENLDLNSDRRNCRGVDCSPNIEIIRALNAGNRFWKVLRQLRLNETEAHDRDEKHDLPVKQPRTRQVTTNQTKDALIDERRE